MKQLCNIIKDLLILYEDDMCSKESKEMVETHLKDCKECYAYFQKLQCTNEIMTDEIEEIKEQLHIEETVMKSGFKKIRKRWRLSVIAIFMLLPAIGLGILGYHEVNGNGIAFSNLREVSRCMKFLKHIEKKKFEKAVQMVDFSQSEYTLVDNVKHMSVEEYQKYMTERVIKQFQEYDSLGLSITNIHYDSAYRRDEDNIWSICIAFDEVYPDGSKQRMIMDFNSQTMCMGAMHYPYWEKNNRDDYIDDILLFYSEDDPLGYSEFEVYFELEEGEKATIHLKNEVGVGCEILNVGVFNITYGTGKNMVWGDFTMEYFETSVPGKYAILGYTNENGYLPLTEEDIRLEIVNYKK